MDLRKWQMCLPHTSSPHSQLKSSILPEGTMRALNYCLTPEFSSSLKHMLMISQE